MKETRAAGDQQKSRKFKGLKNEGNLVGQNFTIFGKNREKVMEDHKSLRDDKKGK